MSSLKEQIVREMIDLLQRAPEGRQIDLGSLVMFLDEESLGWIFGQCLHTYPLFEYCQPYTGWSEEQFQHVIAPLEARLSAYSLHMDFTDPPLMGGGDVTVIQKTPFGGEAAMAAALVTGASASDGEGFSPEEREQLINLILRCTGKTPVEEIIDPGKLRGFLSEAIDEMKDGARCNLQMLWEILLDAPGITQDILIPAFLLMENEESPVPLELPSLVKGLPSKMRETMLVQLGIAKSSEVEIPPSAPPVPDEAAANSGRFMMQRSPEKPATSTANRSVSPEAKAAPPARNSAPPKRAERPKISTPPRAQKNSSDGVGLPRWLLVVAIAVICIGAVVYFFKFRKSSMAILDGASIAASSYDTVFPASEVRLDKRTLRVRVKPVFLSYSASKRVTVAHQLWMHMKKTNPSLHTMILYQPDGTVLQTFGSR